MKDDISNSSDGFPFSVDDPLIPFRRLTWKVSL